MSKKNKEHVVDYRLITALSASRKLFSVAKGSILVRPLKSNTVNSPSAFEFEFFAPGYEPFTLPSELIKSIRNEKHMLVWPATPEGSIFHSEHTSENREFLEAQQEAQNAFYQYGLIKEWFSVTLFDPIDLELLPLEVNNQLAEEQNLNAAMM